MEPRSFETDSSGLGGEGQGQSSTNRAVRVAVLWTHPSGYLLSSMRALMDCGVQLFLHIQRVGVDAPFSELNELAGCVITVYDDSPDETSLEAALRSFDPEIILSSWHVPAFRRICKRARGTSVTIGCADNQWRGTIRQWAGVLLARRLLREPYSMILVAGARQCVWARQMGFRDDEIMMGLYACDTSVFAPSPFGGACADPAFTFVGRLVPEKGVKYLKLAYQQYRGSVKEPWNLNIIGSGSMEAIFRDVVGVNIMGFLQPSALSKVLSQTSCFVMPSVYEPWCVGIHEAAAVGLPIVCTSECGASIHLVHNEYNGFVVPAGSVDQLASALARMSSLSAARRLQMRNGSLVLASQFTPKRFAEQVLSVLGRH